MDEFLYFIKAFFGAPAILIGLFALLGSILLRNKWTDVLISTFKAMVGFCILSVGGAAIATALDHFVLAFKGLIGTSAMAAMGNSDPLAAGILANSQDIAANAALMMFCAMVLNVLLARTSRWKNVFLTGHHVLFISVCMASMFSFANIDVNGEKWYYLIVGATILAVYMTLTPSLTKTYMNDLTNEDKMYIGHANVALGLSLSAAAGISLSKLFTRNKKIKSAEHLRFPKWLSFFQNSTVSVIITMLVLFIVVYLAGWGKMGTDAFKNQLKINENDSIPVTLILDAFMFTAGVEVLIYGIKMMIGELIPALEGVSTRFIKGAKVGVDVSIGLYYQPTSVLLGFLSSFIAGIAVLGISIGLNSANPAVFGLIVIPGIVVHFFNGGVAATFANVKAGYIAAMITGFINGFIVSFIPILFNVMENTIFGGQTFAALAGNESAQALQWGEADYAIFAAVGALATTKVGKWLLLGVGVATYLALTVDGLVKESYEKKHHPEVFYDFALTNVVNKKNFYNLKYNLMLKELHKEYPNKKDEKYLKKSQELKNKIQKNEENYKTKTAKLKVKYQQN